MRNSSRPTLFGKFESAALFGAVDGSMVLLQICSDYDVARRTLSEAFGKSYSEEIDATNVIAAAWTIDTAVKLERVHKDFFRPFAEVVEKSPLITKLVLMPCTLDTPLLPNDFLDRRP